MYHMFQINKDKRSCKTSQEHSQYWHKTTISSAAWSTNL